MLSPWRRCRTASSSCRAIRDSRTGRARAWNPALRATQFLQVGEAVEFREPGVGDVEVRQEMERELEPLELLHPRDDLQLRVPFEAAARPGRKCRPRQEQFADVLQPRDVGQFRGRENRPGEVDAGHLERAGGQFGERRQRLPLPFTITRPCFRMTHSAASRSVAAKTAVAVRTGRIPVFSIPGPDQSAAGAHLGFVAGIAAGLAAFVFDMARLAKRHFDDSPSASRRRGSLRT